MYKYERYKYMTPVQWSWIIQKDILAEFIFFYMLVLKMMGITDARNVQKIGLSKIKCKFVFYISLLNSIWLSDEKCSQHFRCIALYRKLRK